MDPLSPFLFLIVVEALQVTILDACNKGIYKGVTIGDDGSNLSLLQYADDALFFGEWSVTNARNLIRILVCFHDASGLRVNLSKSCIYGIGVNHLDMETMASYITCAYWTLPFNYLGLPVRKNMGREVSWNEIVDRVLNRLSSWKAKTLSIKSVLGSLPLYYFSVFKVPMNVVKALEAIRCRFFWGLKDREKGIAWVKWKSILLNGEQGGLGQCWVVWQMEMEIL